MTNIKKPSKLFSLLILGIMMVNCSGKEEQKTEPTLIEIVETTPAELSLYDRLGGAEGISSIVDDIIVRHLENPIVSPQFVYLTENPERMEIVKRHTREFLGMGTGGKETYTGVDVPTAHQGMNVSNAEFLEAVDDILFVLNEHGVSEQTKKDMLYILYSFKGQVIGL
jgi:hemoglobin